MIDRNFVKSSWFLSIWVHFPHRGATEDLRHDERISRPSLHLQLVGSQTLAAQPLTIHTTPSWTLFVYMFQAEGRLFIQEFAVKTAKRHGPRKKKGGSHIEKKPTGFFFTRRSKEPNVVEAVKMKGSQEVWRCWQWTNEPESFMIHQNHSSKTPENRQTWKAAAKCKSRPPMWRVLRIVSRRLILEFGSRAERITLTGCVVRIAASQDLFY